MSFEIKPAERTGVKPLVGFYGRSGSGKTFSSLLFARGLVGESGRVVLIDSENGRGSLFADIVPGGYSVLEIDAPFSPERYQEAIVEAEKQADCIVIDSLSHSWLGEGGVLDMQEAELDRMAGDNYSKREACKMASWIKPKLQHKAMVQRILRCKVAMICCLRAEEKTHMQKAKDGEKAKVITDEFSTPLYDQRFIYELLLNFECISRNGQGGYVIPRKITHPSIAALLPSENEQIGIKHGQLLRQWCEMAGSPTGKVESLDDLKSQLWKRTKSKHGGKVVELEKWLKGEGLMHENICLADLKADEIKGILTVLTGKGL